MNSYSRILNWINHHLVTCYCRNPGNLLWVSPTYYNLKGYFPFSSSIMIHINFSLKVSRAASASSAPPHLVSGVFTVAISGDLGTPWRSESWCLADLANLANLSPPALPSSIILNTRNINFINTDKCLNFESKYLLDTDRAAVRGAAALLCNILQRAGLSLLSLPRSWPCCDLCHDY